MKGDFMNKYIISCCSTADLSREHFEKINVKFICFHYELDGVMYSDDLGQTIPFDEFYQKMADGAETKTSQINAGEFEAYFAPFLEDGYDILHECLSPVSLPALPVLSILPVLQNPYWKNAILTVKSILLIPSAPPADTA